MTKYMTWLFAAFSFGFAPRVHSAPENSAPPLTSGACSEECDKKASDCVDACDAKKDDKQRVQCKLACISDREKCEKGCT